MDKVVKTEEEWRKILSPDEFRIAQKGTSTMTSREPAYECVRCATDLFSSDAKYDSGTGWPSFWGPISE